MPMRKTRITAIASAAIVIVALGCRPRSQPLTIPPSADPFIEERGRMVIAQLEGRDITDSEVLRAMHRVPRHEFVPEDQVRFAYDDHPLPIGEGQTISQPYIVALMTQAVQVKSGDRVLEIGTGSGYQAAVLAELTNEIYTIEIIETLGEQAANRLRRLGYSLIHAQVGDGYFGWEEHAPFDAIVVTCAPDHIPRSLVSQLKVGGRMVVPVGPPGAYQSLWLLERQADGSVQRRNLGGVRFVPMTGVAFGGR
jgi:protein-L-isoaspartate(D-aspartate) O-methyltransferase